MTRTKIDTPSDKKRPYETPTLIVYGDLARVATSKGGNKSDGGSPKPNTRNAGGNA